MSERVRQSVMSHNPECNFFTQHKICTINCPREKYLLKLLYEISISVYTVSYKSFKMCSCVFFLFVFFDHAGMSKDGTVTW